MNDEWGIMWMRVICNVLLVIVLHSLEELRKITENLSQESSPISPEYKTGLPNCTMRHFVYETLNRNMLYQ